MSMTINDVLAEIGRCGLKTVERIDSLAKEVHLLVGKSANHNERLKDLGLNLKSLLHRVEALENREVSKMRPQPIDPPEPDESMMPSAEEVAARRAVDAEPRDVGREMAERMVATINGKYVSIETSWLEPVGCWNAERNTGLIRNIIADAINKAVAEERERIVAWLKENRWFAAAKAIAVFDK